MVNLAPRGVLREVTSRSLPLRDVLPLKLWEMDPLLDGTPDYMMEEAVAQYDERRHCSLGKPEQVQGGEGGIRTHEGLLSLTRFPGERPKPD